MEVLMMNSMDLSCDYLICMVESNGIDQEVKVSRHIKGQAANRNLKTLKKFSENCIEIKRARKRKRK